MARTKKQAENTASRKESVSNFDLFNFFIELLKMLNEFRCFLSFTIIRKRAKLQKRMPFFASFIFLSACTWFGGEGDRHEKEPQRVYPEGVSVEIISSPPAFEGDGAAGEVEVGDEVYYHYRISLLDGREVADSRGGDLPPARTTVGSGDTLAGIDLGLRGLRVGQRALVRVASRLAYGTRGNGRLVPPDADLLVEVEVISVK